MYIVRLYIIPRSKLTWCLQHYCLQATYSVFKTNDNGLSLNENGHQILDGESNLENDLASLDLHC